MRVFNDLFGMGIACGLAVLFTWVAFGPGPRHFSMSVDGLFFAGSHETGGRVAFGFCAVLGWLIVALGIRATLRRWREPTKA